MAKNKKNKLIVKYDSVSDALALVLREGPEGYFEELAPGVSVEFNNKGGVLGFEILNASRYFKRTIKPLSQKIKELALAIS